MTEKARIKIELDTSAGESDLRKLGRDGEKAAGQVNDSFGGVGRAATMGAVAGAGFGLAQRAASRVGGFIPDVLSEGSVAFRAGVDDFLMGPEARAARFAREQTKDAFSEIIGRQQNPSVTPDIRNYYNNVREFREVSERGGAAIDKEFGADFVQDGVQSFVEAISGGFDRVVEALGVTGK